VSFKHLVDEKRNIVVLKAKGKISVIDIISEIQKAIDTKRGVGITRRLLDMTDQESSFELKDAQKILKMVKASSNTLGSKKIAMLFNEIPDIVKSDEIRSLLNSPTLDIRFFTDKAKAAQFLNKPSAKKK